jgi:signal peptidase I
MRKALETVLGFVWETAKIVIISLLIIIPIRYFVVQPFFVRGESMAATFENGDYLIIEEISYRFSKPARGDVIVFRFPEDPSQFFIKRIVALPEETVRISSGEVVIVNKENPAGFVLDEPYLTEDTPGSIELRLDRNEYFVLGDNRDASSDSRRWGALSEHLIVGKVWLRAWPIDRAQAFTTPSY